MKWVNEIANHINWWHIIHDNWCLCFVNTIWKYTQAFSCFFAPTSKNFQNMFTPTQNENRLLQNNWIYNLIVLNEGLQTIPTQGHKNTCEIFQNRFSKSKILQKDDISNIADGFGCRGTRHCTRDSNPYQFVHRHAMLNINLPDCPICNQF